jgi:hypothetical protein
MKALHRSVVALALVCCCAVPLGVHRSQQKKLVQGKELRKEVLSKIQHLKAENEMLRGIIANSRSAAALPQDDFLELMRLRSEAGRLKSLARENHDSAIELEEMRRGLLELDAEKMNGQNEPLAVLEEQKELRQARLGRLNEWLKSHPRESIPELKLLNQESWIRSADETPITEEDYSLWISSQRNNAVKNFSIDIFKAVKRYQATHQGRFPPTVSELRPYFERPVEADALERYEITPADSLVPPLSGAGGDWVITQRPELGTPFETRVAIGSSRVMATSANDGWGMR